MPSKKQQMSLFLVSMSTSTVALASTCSIGYYDPNNGSNCIPAPPGSYVATPGATTATLAEPGRFTSTPGMTTALLALPGTYTPNPGMTAGLASPVGYYIPNAGSSSPTLAPAGTFAPYEQMIAPLPAPVGYYVPTAGATTATAVSSGFYAPATGMANQLPTGGMAASLTAALQASQALQQLNGDLFNSTQDQSLKVAAAYQRNTVKQEALTSSEFKTHISSIALQADLQKSGSDVMGLQASYANHRLNNSDVTNTGNSYQFGAFKSGLLGDTQYQASLVYGKTNSNNQRNISVQYSTDTAIENLSSKGDVSWYGLTTRASHPLTRDFSAIAELGVLSYKADAIHESGTATINGSSVSSVAALSTEGLRYTSIPALLGVSYDLLPKVAGQKQAPIVVTLGITGDFASKQNLAVNSSAGRVYNLSVKQTSANAGLIKMSFNGWEISKDVNVSGTLQAQAGSDTMVYQAGINLVKKW